MTFNPLSCCHLHNYLKVSLMGIGVKREHLCLIFTSNFDFNHTAFQIYSVCLFCKDKWRSASVAILLCYFFQLRFSGIYWTGIHGRRQAGYKLGDIPHVVRLSTQTNPKDQVTPTRIPCHPHSSCYIPANGHLWILHFLHTYCHSWPKSPSAA